MPHSIPLGWEDVFSQAKAETAARLAPDLDTAFAFLHALEPNVFEHEFCWFASKGDDQAMKVRQRYGRFNEDTIDWLTELNRMEFNIFVCVNAIDTPAYVGDYAKRRAADISRVRAIFGDFDDPTKPLPAFAMEPSLVVQTSPGKHHVYWLTCDVPLAEFRGVQASIIAKHGASGSDPAIKDLSRVMRVPGFWHMKDPRNSSMVTLATNTGVIYSREQVLRVFPPTEPAGRAWPEAVPCPPSSPVAALVLSFAKANAEHETDTRIDIVCPWSDRHTTGTQGTSYFKPSTNNAGRGGFKCQHAHCSNRTIHDLSDWVYKLCAGVV